MTPKPHIAADQVTGERRIRNAARYAADVLRYYAILPDRLKTKCYLRYQLLRTA